MSLLVVAQLELPADKAFKGGRGQHREDVPCKPM
jgi:hypothetical protein